MEILTRKYIFLNKGNWPHAITSLSPLSANTSPNERSEFKHTESALKCHSFTCEKTLLSLPLTSVINYNFKSISCLTMDCMVHPVFFFCLITYLLHLLILVASDTKQFFRQCEVDSVPWHSELNCPGCYRKHLFSGYLFWTFKYITKLS